MSFRSARLLVFAARMLALGCLSGRATEVKPAEPAIALPPFLVEANGKGPPWRITRSPEFEILSRCPDSTTQEIAQNYHRLHRLLGVVLPERFQVKFDVPKTLILYDQELLPPSVQAIIANAKPSNALPTPMPSPDRHYAVLRNPRLTDIDQMTVFASVPASAFYPEVSSHAAFDAERMAHPDYRPGWTSLTPNYVGDLIGKRTPPLPLWFISGFAGLYRQMHFSENTIEVGAISWLSEAETRDLRKNKAVPFLLPMGELLDGPHGNAQKIDLWFAQAELFVRWALDDQRGAGRESLWKFLDRSRTELVSEALFKECFGLDYDRATAALKQYLSSAVFKSVTWHAEGPVDLAALPFSDATFGDVARIKGDWERLAAGYVRTNSPAFETTYLDQARRTLRRAYEKGDRDPRLLAALGLCECDVGNDSGAREYLEAAMRGGVVRPRAYLELGRVRYADQRLHPEAAEAKLSAAQTASVLAPLLIARQQAPPLRAVYELIAEVWANSATSPGRTDLALLNEGITFFPGSSELIYRTATLYFAQGWSDEARQLADAGLRSAPNDATRDRFAKLRDSIVAAKPIP